MDTLEWLKQDYENRKNKRLARRQRSVQFYKPGKIQNLPAKILGRMIKLLMSVLDPVDDDDVEPDVSLCTPRDELDSRFVQIRFIGLSLMSFLIQTLTGPQRWTVLTNLPSIPTT